MGQVIAHGRAALRVSLALVAGLRTPGAGCPWQAWLDCPFGAGAKRVMSATAVLQSRAVPGQVELHQGGDAMAWTLLSVPDQHRSTCTQVVFVGVVAIGFGLAVHDGLPADEPAAVGRRGRGGVEETQQ